MTRIPLVRLCEVSDCGFNEANMCHAAAIQVGDQLAVAPERGKLAVQDPRCDTYVSRPGSHLGASDLRAQVGSCKVETCTYNERFRCNAEAIVVSHHDGHADCKTFHRRDQG